MQKMQISLKRAYEDAGESDGCRMLVDRLWPRGVTKERAAIDLWAKESAPSPELRKWFNHEGGEWTEFKKRYFAELDGNPSNLDAIREQLQKGPVTFVYAKKDTQINSAVALDLYFDAF